MGETGRAGVRSGSGAGTAAYLIGGGASDGGADGACARRGAAEGGDVADRGRGEGQGAHLTRIVSRRGDGHSGRSRTSGAARDDDAGGEGQRRRWARPAIPGRADHGSASRA